jgi:hypothetical protein
MFIILAIAEPSPVCILVLPFGIFYLNFLLPERPLDGAASFFIDIFFVTDQRFAQVMNLVNRWPLWRTYARGKLFAFGGN